MTNPSDNSVQFSQGMSKSFIERGNVKIEALNFRIFNYQAYRKDLHKLIFKMSKKGKRQ